MGESKGKEPSPSPPGTGCAPAVGAIGGGSRRPAFSRARETVIRLLRLWDSIRTSYWFLPSVMVVGALALYTLTNRLDEADRPEWLREIGWVYSGGPDGAREVLSTIAASMMGVAGVTFSVTIVALSLASQQFGPHLLYNFMRDRGNQVVLGTFISTFVYCILVLRTIYGENDGVDEFIPYIGTTAAVLLAIGSVGVLIFFIHHVSMSIQAPTVVTDVARSLHRSIARHGKHLAGRDPSESELAEIERELQGLLVREARAVCCEEEGYIQAIDQKRLFELARRHDLLLRLPHRPGHHVLLTEPIAHVSPVERCTPAVEAEIHEAVVIGARRTALQDLEFSVDQLSEVAVRALSTGINDPYTAVNCVDRLGATLAHLIREGFPSPYRVDEDGRLRLVQERPLTFAGVMDAAFAQIRQHVGESFAVHLRLLETLTTMLAHCRRPHEVGVVRQHGVMVERAARGNLAEEWDLRDLAERLDALGQAARAAEERLTARRA
jgi:uncharacterized membrane protein